MQCTIFPAVSLSSLFWPCMAGWLPFRRMNGLHYPYISFFWCMSNFSLLHLGIYLAVWLSSKKESKIQFQFHKKVGILYQLIIEVKWIWWPLKCLLILSFCIPNVFNSSTISCHSPGSALVSVPCELWLTFALNASCQLGTASTAINGETSKGLLMPFSAWVPPLDTFWVHSGVAEMPQFSGTCTVLLEE